MTEPAVPRVGGDAPDASGTDNPRTAASAPSAVGVSGSGLPGAVRPEVPTRGSKDIRGKWSHDSVRVALADKGRGDQRVSDRGGQQPNNRNRRWLVTAGWVLYLLSWVTPSLDGRQFGATAFVDSARLAWHFFGTGSLLPGLCVALGWLANFSVFLRQPCWLRVVAIVAPWLAFAVVLAKVPARATFFLYFYPWALGIALIHAARCSSRKAAS